MGTKVCENCLYWGFRECAQHGWERREPNDTCDEWESESCIAVALGQKNNMEKSKMTREEAIKTIMSANVWTDEERTALEILIPELSESEDERIRKWIYNLVENLGYPADEEAEKEIEEMQPLALSWLKSLRLQPHWKPTEEQLMKEAIEFKCIGKKVKMTVQELINYYIDSECVAVAEEYGF